ncbi:MAG: O-methyltransferase [Bacteroidota bacterium]|nr:O-methyltransferase [Bacteroidota bacterium]
MLAFEHLDLNKYCEDFTSNEDDTLKELERQTHLLTLSPQMLSGKIQGRFLSTLSKLLKPTYILEIGTFTGYSALCLAEGLEENGVVHTVDISADYQHLIDQYAKKSAFASKVVWHRGDALDVIQTMKFSWDIVFVDGAKNQYLDYLHAVKSQIRPGGLLITDNVLWSGKVLLEKKDKDTQIIHSYNEYLLTLEDFTTVILPIRDGISLSFKNQ